MELKLCMFLLINFSKNGPEALVLVYGNLIVCESCAGMDVKEHNCV